MLGVADDGDADSKTRGRGALRNRFRSVVRALRVHIRPEQLEQALHIQFLKNHHAVHGGERGDEFGASAFVQDWPAGPLQLPRARIRIDGNNQDVAFAPRGFQIADVSHMQEIENAVGEDDGLAVGAGAVNHSAEHIRRHDFVAGIHREGWPARAAACAAAAGVSPVISPRRAPSNSACVTVAVPRFITTIPPA